MDIKRVDHYSIRTRDLERSQRFYTEVIGLTAGPRPPFDFPGFWLYSGEPPSDLHNPARNYGLVHLMGWNPDKPSTLDAYVGARPAAKLEGGTGSLDHVAFAATGREAMLARCLEHGIDFIERSVPLLGLIQVFIQDPDGVTLELNVPASENPQAKGARATADAR
jgi:catechol 2,3-dioxygenase-like lactoylglutathione lyase family enzyme